MKNFGDKLYKAILDAKDSLLIQGEMANLTWISYDYSVGMIKKDDRKIIPIDHPIGYNPDHTPITSTIEYTKENLISRYDYLAFQKLPIDGIFRLVTIIETLLTQLLRFILIEYPYKLSNKRKIDIEIVLSALSLDDIKASIINSILNEITYKSPKDYSIEFEKYVGINLLKYPVFNRYIELKATRDIYIHNGGIANDIYVLKADLMDRVKSNESLPVDIQYFLESYEVCLQLTEILEGELNKIWPRNDHKLKH